MKLYYGLDTLCVFCYGFSPLVSRLYDQYQEDVEFVFLPAAMWREDQEKLVTPVVAQRLKQSIQRVGRMTGQPYGEAFIKYLATGPSLSSYEGAKALNVVAGFTDVNPTLYLAGLYEAVFVKGKNPSETKTLVDVAVSVGIAKDVFLKAFNDPGAIDMTDEKIALLKEKHIDSFPSLVLDKDGEMDTYPLNYESYEALEKWLKTHMA